MSETTSTPAPSWAPHLAGDDLGAADHETMWAGRVDFPRGPGDLRSVTICPACHAPLRSPVCAVCALDLRHPDAAELAAISAQTADLLDARRALIGRLRRDAAAASRPRAAEPGAAPAPPPASTIPPQPALPAAARRRSRRSGIQVALLVVGISLLSIFAIFWLAYAFLVYGSPVRMLIIAAGTLATLAAAAGLSRRGLTATAEGIAVLGTIILLLDAWALRANDPEGLGAVAGSLYWGVSLLVIATVAVAWSRLGALASPAVGAALVLPLGAALLAGHVADDARPEVDAIAVVAGLSAVIAALAHPVMAPPGRSRTAVVVALSALAAGAPGAVLALAAGVGGSLGQSGAGPLPLLTGAALALVAAAHAIAAARLPGPPVVAVAVAGTAAAGGALALLAGAASTIVQNHPGPTTAAVALLVVAAVAVALSLVPARTGLARDVTRLGALLAAATVAAAAATVTLLSALRPLLEAAESILTELDDPGSTVQIATESDLAALGGTAATLALTALGGRLGGPLRPLVPFTAPVLALLVAAAVPLAGAWWLVLTLAAVLAIGAALVIAPTRAIEPGAARSAALIALGILAIGGSLTALVVAPRLDSAWILGTAAALLAIALGRRATPPGAATVGALGVAVVLVLAAAPALVDDLARARVGATDAGVLLALAALVIIGAVLSRLDDRERKAAALLGAVGGIGGALLLADADADARVAVTDGLAALLTVATLALVVLRTRLVVLRRPAAALLGPAVALLMIVGLRGVAASAGFETVAGVRLWGPSAALASLLLVAAIALATLGRASRADRRASEHRSTRRAIDAGALAIGLGMLGLALDRDAAVLGLLLSAALVLTVAVSGDGLIGSTSRRRHLGWIALALGTASLWTGLAEEHAADPEGYAVPLAGALLLIAAALARRDAARGAPARRAAPLIGAALAIALLPVGLLSGIAPGAPTNRSAVVALVALATLAVVVARTEQLERSIPSLPLVLASISVTALGVVGGVLTADLVATPAAPLDEQLRGLLVVVVLAGAATAVRVGSSGALHGSLAGVLLGLAGLVAAALGLAGVVAPVELIALPVALAALAIGVLELERRPAASSWPLLAPGILLLLTPSLIAITDQPDPWRIVALGVVSAGVLLGGLQQRLQAPFVLGGSVLLVHALVQSWPLLSRAAAAVDWWIWLGIVGILVVAVAARYERRVQNLTAVARRIADLR